MAICVGREKEKRLLEDALSSAEPEMIAMIGRRRVGKTFLIRSVYDGKIDFEITGIHTGSLSEQLQNFAYQLREYTGSAFPLPKPASWIEAFMQLSAFLQQKKIKRKKVVFIDELPWIATHRSGFMKALENFWNSWASKKKIVVVLCGSSATWMLKRLVHNKGGLHNRITKTIHLQPFNLFETRQFLESRKVALDLYQTLQIYMVMGGIPHYLKELRAGQSAAQNTDRICFRLHGLLTDEFSRLFPSLFDNPEHHLKIIRALGSKRMGLSRKEIVGAIPLSDGGSISRLLDELLSSGFVTAYMPFGKRKKTTLYRLTDEFSLFYLKFMEGRKPGTKGVWQQLSQAQSWTSWSGYAFENLCLKHISQIKKALGIEGVYSEESGFYKPGNAQQQGVQIDLLIDRKDQMINVCEMKFSSSQIALSKADAGNLRQKLASFQRATNTRKQTVLTLITTFGLTPNENSIGLIDQHLSMEALFEPD